MLCVFFFKQKTAYEMRISDWSSDVCSSDLGACQGLAPALLTLGTEGGGSLMAAATSDAPAVADRDPEDLADRRSVVSGKSGSVRVDLGGRRIIKKKNTEANT